MSSAYTATINKALKWLLEVIFPAFCFGCGKEGLFLCKKCAGSIPKQQQQLCPLCYKANGSGIVCAACRKPDFYLDCLWVMSKFEEKSLLQKSIHALKYDFVEELAQQLGEMLLCTFYSLARADQSNEYPNYIFCPIPLHPKRLKWRGFNQAQLLAKAILKQSKNTALNNAKMLMVLRRTHFRRAQMELVREERLKNMDNAFILDNTFVIENAKNSLANNQNNIFFLIDDVATTLATLNAAAKTLKLAGARHVNGLVLARVY